MRSLPYATSKGDREACRPCLSRLTLTSNTHRLGLRTNKREVLRLASLLSGASLKTTIIVSCLICRSLLVLLQIGLTQHLWSFNLYLLMENPGSNPHRSRSLFLSRTTQLGLFFTVGRNLTNQRSCSFPSCDSEALASLRASVAAARVVTLQRTSACLFHTPRWVSDHLYVRIDVLKAATYR